MSIQNLIRASTQRRSSRITAGGRRPFGARRQSLLELLPIGRTDRRSTERVWKQNTTMLLRQIRCEERGAALVEFALVLPILAVLLFGLLDFGKAFNYWIDGTHLANEGARWAVVNKNPGAAEGTLQEYIRRQATTDELQDGGTASLPDPLQVCISFPTGASQIGDSVEVTVSATYNWLSVLGLEMPTVIKGRSTMRLEALPTSYEAGCSSS